MKITTQGSGIHVGDRLEEKIADKSFFNPLVFFSIILLIIVALDFSKNKSATAFLYGFDGLLFFLVGATGILLVFMW